MRKTSPSTDPASVEERLEGYARTELKAYLGVAMPSGWVMVGGDLRTLVLPFSIVPPPTQVGGGRLAHTRLSLSIVPPPTQGRWRETTCAHSS